MNLRTYQRSHVTREERTVFDVYIGGVWQGTVCHYPDDGQWTARDRGARLTTGHDPGSSRVTSRDIAADTLPRVTR